MYSVGSSIIYCSIWPGAAGSCSVIRIVFHCLMYPSLFWRPNWTPSHVLNNTNYAIWERVNLDFFGLIILFERTVSITAARFDICLFLQHLSRRKIHSWISHWVNGQYITLSKRIKMKTWKDHLSLPVNLGKFLPVPPEQKVLLWSTQLRHFLTRIK